MVFEALVRIFGWLAPLPAMQCASEPAHGPHVSHEASYIVRHHTMALWLTLHLSNADLHGGQIALTLPSAATSPLAALGWNVSQ